MNHLADIPHLAAEAWATWGTHLTDDTHTHRVPGPITLADLDRIVLLDATTDQGIGILHQWARVITEEHPDHPQPPHDTVDDVCHWITAHADWWEAEPWAADLLTETRRLWRELRAICGYREVWLPHCRTCGDRIRLYDSDGHEIDPQRLQSEGLILDHTECAGCGHIIEPGLELEHLARVRYYTLPELAAITGLPSATLYRWADRGLIKPVDHRHHQKLYSHDEIRQVAARTRSSA